MPFISALMFLSKTSLIVSRYFNQLNNNFSGLFSLSLALSPAAPSAQGALWQWGGGSPAYTQSLRRRLAPGDPLSESTKSPRLQLQSKRVGDAARQRAASWGL
jgi:hypothetical protein